MWTDVEKLRISIFTSFRIHRKILQKRERWQRFQKNNQKTPSSTPQTQHIELTFYIFSFTVSLLKLEVPDLMKQMK